MTLEEQNELELLEKKRMKSLQEKKKLTEAKVKLDGFKKLMAKAKKLETLVNSIGSFDQDMKSKDVYESSIEESFDAITYILKCNMFFLDEVEVNGMMQDAELDESTSVSMEWIKAVLKTYPVLKKELYSADEDYISTRNMQYQYKLVFNL